MENDNRSGFRDHATSCETPKWISTAHVVLCTGRILVIAVSFLQCIVSFRGAVHDARKFGGLGFSYTFFHYLTQNDFPVVAFMFLAVLAELLHYLYQYRRAAEQRPLRWGMWCFVVLVVLHGVIYLHANCFADIADVILAHYYRRYANYSLLPSALYFTMYRTWLQAHS